MRRFVVTIMIFLITFIVKNPHVFAQSKIDSLVILVNTSEGEEKLNVLFNLGILNFNRDSINLSYNYLLKTADLAKKLDNKDVETNALNTLGYIYLHWGDFTEALVNFMEAHKIGLEMNDKNTILISLHGMSRAYTDLGKLDKALEISTLGLNIAIEVNQKQEQAAFYNSFSKIFVEQELYDTALICLEKCYILSKELNDVRSMVYALNNIGEIYLIEKNYSTALLYLERSLKENKELQDPQGNCAAYGNIGQIYIRKKEYELAIEYLNKSLEISRGQNMNKFTILNYSMLSEAYEKQDRNVEALKYLHLHIKLKDSLYTEEKDKQIQDLEYKFTTRQNVRKLELLEQISGNQKLWIFLMASLATLALLIMILFIKAYKLRLRRHSEQKLEMKQTIDSQNRKITSNLFSSVQQRKLLDEVENISKRWSYKQVKKNEIEKELENLSTLIRSCLNIEDEWESIKFHFDNVHPDFFRKLQNSYQKLTQYDLKQLAYIKMNLTTKDIARILSISDKAVQTARYRIKKKMKLAKETDFISFIQNL